MKLLTNSIFSSFDGFYSSFWMHYSLAAYVICANDKLTHAGFGRFSYISLTRRYLLSLGSTFARYQDIFHFCLFSPLSEIPFNQQPISSRSYNTFRNAFKMIIVWIQIGKGTVWCVLFWSSICQLNPFFCWIVLNSSTLENNVIYSPFT